VVAVELAAAWAGAVVAEAAALLVAVGR